MYEKIKFHLVCTQYEYWPLGANNPKWRQSRVVAVNDAVNITAVFKLKEYTLDPTLFGEGVTLNGSSTPITVTMGQEVTALATATDECEEFKNWNDDNTENPRTFTYDGTATPFTVVYGTKLFTVTANAAATEGDITIELIP